MKPSSLSFLIVAVIALAPLAVALEAPLLSATTLDLAASSPAPGVPYDPTRLVGATPPFPFGSPEDPARDRAVQKDPYYRFLTRLAVDEERTPDTVVPAVQDFFHDLGYNVPASNALDAINETATLSFTHPIGDVDGDGNDDVAFDIYCVAWDECLEPRGLDLTKWICVLPHWLEIRSGATGEVIWKHRLDNPATVPLLSCSIEMFVGSFPSNPDYDNLLIYQWQIVWAGGAFVFLHDQYALDGRGESGHGKVLWHYTEVGATDLTWSVAKNLFLLPHLQTPPKQGVRLLPETLQATLWVRSMGWAVFGLYDWLVTDDWIIFEYQPIEWASTVDLATGDERWRHDTFMPQTERSVYPLSFPDNYWFGGGCCWDFTKDGKPDLIFATLEWAPVPALQGTVGPVGWASRDVAYDWSDGHRLYDVETQAGYEADVYFTWLSALGDATGDGIADYFQETIAFNWTQDWHITDLKFSGDVRDGKDAKRLWGLSGDDWLDILVLGDADGDLGNDFLIAFYEIGRSVSGICGAGFLDQFANVTEVRLVVHNGARGTPVWEKQTFAAPMDLQSMFTNSRTNGLADLDGDNVGDVWLDRPKQTDDLTVIHRQTFLSGRDGTDLITVDSVGAFAFPIGAKDLDGDGGNDFTITQGDIVDLWITAHNGRTSDPLWSRRLMEIPVSGATFVLPLLRYHSLELDGNATKTDVLLSFTMFVLSAGGGFCSFSFYQQHQADQGFVGRLRWAVPEIWDEDPDISLHIGAPTPATALYTGWTPPAPPTNSHSGFPVPVPVMMGATSVLSVGLAFLAVRRWMR